MKEIITPLTQDKVNQLRTGDRVRLSGWVYTARDTAHLRFCRNLREGKKLPFEPKDQIIYYAGPAPAKPGRIIGSIGPTTSYRMDFCTPQLLERGLKGMIGKGERSYKVKEAIKKYGAVYMIATGGAAAFLSSFVKEAVIFAYEELGPEAVYHLRVENLPLVVAIDCRGRDLFEEETDKWRKESQAD